MPQKCTVKYSSLSCIMHVKTIVYLDLASQRGLALLALHVCMYAYVYDDIALAMMHNGYIGIHR